MPAGRITKRAVDALKCPPGRDRMFLWDAALAGFGLAVFPSGKKVYVAQFRKDGRSRRMSLGEHGRLTPDEARSAAKKVLGAVEGGADPIAKRREERGVRTFREVAEEFLALHVATKRKTRTQEEYRRLLKLHVYPAIGSKRIVDVRRADVARMHAHLAHKPVIANKALAVISSAWNWAARRDEVAAAQNPARGIERYREERRERFLSREELGRLGDTLRAAETVGLPWSVDETSPMAKHAPKAEKRLVSIDPFAIAAIRLLILSGARLREILRLEWPQIDLERGMAFLPTSKTGPKPIYLSAAAQAVLATLPRVHGNPHVIASRGSGSRADLKRPWAAVTRAAGLPGLRLHDLRHSFASFGAGASLGLPVIGKLLGHSQPATTARYAHLDADPMRRAAEMIGTTISGALDKGASSVVPLPARGR